MKHCQAAGEVTLKPVLPFHSSCSTQCLFGVCCYANQRWKWKNASPASEATKLRFVRCGQTRLFSRRTSQNSSNNLISVPGISVVKAHCFLYSCLLCACYGDNLTWTWIPSRTPSCTWNTVHHWGKRCDLFCLRLGDIGLGQLERYIQWHAPVSIAIWSWPHHFVLELRFSVPAWRMDLWQDQAVVRMVQPVNLFILNAYFLLATYALHFCHVPYVK